MKSVSTLMERFPARAPEIRRLYFRDEGFRNACEDYQVALTALRHWGCDQRNAARALEYRQLTEEIADEIIARLDTASEQKTVNL